MPKERYIQIESKNALLELLKEGREFDRIYLASSAYRDDKTIEIVELAEKKKIPVIRVPRKVLTRRLRASSSESVIGMMFSENSWTLENLLEKIMTFVIINLLSHII